MVKIRMAVFGKHKDHCFRIVAIDSKKKRDGGYLELLGTYNINSPNKLSLNKEGIMKYLKNGAQPSETVKNFLKQQGIWKEFSKTK